MMVADPRGRQWVRRLERQDWSILCDLRLEALRDAADHLLGDRSAEGRRDEVQWRQCFDDREWYVGYVDGRPVALASLVVSGVAPPAWYLESMWVRPDWRAHGLGRLLVEHAVQTVKTYGATDLNVCVLDANDAARVVFERLGFQVTGGLQPVLGHPDLKEYRLNLTWTSGCPLVGHVMDFQGSGSVHGDPARTSRRAARASTA